MSRMVIFVEDPGAVNCIAPLAERLRERGTPIHLYAAGAAVELLRDRGIEATTLQAGDDVLAAQPCLLLTGTSENPLSPAFDMIGRARSAGLPSVAIVDSMANSAHRFRGTGDDALAHAPDRLMVPDAPTRQAYVDLGFDAAAIDVVGHPNDDRIRAVAIDLAAIGQIGAREATTRAGADRFVIVFVSEISDGLDPQQYRRRDDYTLAGSGRTDLRTAIVVEELLAAVAALAAEGRPRPFLVLRRHPKESSADLGELADRFDEISTGGNPHMLVYGADLVLGMSSMLLAEAALLGRPTLAILPRSAERDWLAAVRDGIVPAVTDAAALRDALREHLSGRGAPVRALPERADSAVERIIDVIDRMAA